MEYTRKPIKRTRTCNFSPNLKESPPCLNTSRIPPPAPTKLNPTAMILACREQLGMNFRLALMLVISICWLICWVTRWECIIGSLVVFRTAAEGRSINFYAIIWFGRCWGPYWRNYRRECLLLRAQKLFTCYYIKPKNRCILILKIQMCYQGFYICGSRVWNRRRNKAT